MPVLHIRGGYIWLNFLIIQNLKILLLTYYSNGNILEQGKQGEEEEEEEEES